LLRNPPLISPVIKTEMAPLDFRIIGLTTEILPNIYLIQLNSRYTLERLERTFFHELVHVYQFEKGLLKEGFGLVTWRGQISTWDQPWGDRPWEQHAEELTHKLFIPRAEICK